MLDWPFSLLNVTTDIFALMEFLRILLAAGILVVFPLLITTEYG